MRATDAVIVAVVCLVGIALAETPQQTNLRGVELFKSGAYAESESTFHAALAGYKAAPVLDVNGYASALNNLAGSLLLQGRTRDAEAPLREAIALDKRIVDEPQIVTSALNNLAIVHQSRNELPKAIALLRRILDRPRVDTADRTGVLHNIGAAYFLMNQRKKAREYFERSLALSNELGGTSDTPATLAYLAKVAMAAGEEERAGDLVKQSLALRRKLHGDNHPIIGLSLSDLAEYYRDTKQYQTAAETFDQAFHLLHSTVGKDHPHVAVVAFHYAETMRAQGRHEEAIELYRQALRILEVATAPGSLTLATVYRSASACAAKLKRKQESKEYALRAQELTKGAIPWAAHTVDASSFRRSSR